MSKGPVQVVLNTDSYIDWVEDSKHPMGRKDFYVGDNAKFIEHKLNILSQLDDIESSQKDNPYSRINYVKVRMIQEALAKSHRPTGKLFTSQNQCKLVGGGHRGEMLFEVSPQSIHELKRDINEHVEDVPVRKLNKNTNKKELNPSEWRCELGAIESVSLYSSEDKIDFSHDDLITQIRSYNGCFYIDLFEMPSSEQHWDTLDYERFKLYSTLKKGLESIQGVKVSRSSIRGSQTLLIMRIDDTSSSKVSFSNRVNNRSRLSMSSVSHDYMKYEQAFHLLAHHPLVRKVSLVPSLINIPVPSFRIDGSERGIVSSPKKDEDYPLVAIVDNGLSPIFSEWLVDSWDNIPERMRDKNHGSFIAGLLINGAAWNPSVCKELDGCKVIDLCLLPEASCFDTVYPYGIESFINELENAVSDTVANCNVRIFNMSLNIPVTRLNTDYSPLSQALDRIAVDNDIIFVISAGNLNLVRPEWSSAPKDNVLVINGRKDDIVYCPAESIRNISVGALNSDGNGLSSYSCKGKGSTFGVKPEFVHKGGNGEYDPVKGYGLYSVNKDGLIHSSCGTSFAAPLVAKTMAVVENAITGHISRESLIALMVHSAEIPIAFQTKEYKDILEELIGYGMPLKAEDILNGDEHSITLVFAGRIRNKKKLSFQFAWPASLIKNNKCTGTVKVTLVSTPEIDYRFGDEMIRENVSVALRKINEDGTKHGMLKPRYKEGKPSGTHMYEWQLIDSEQKWNPIKAYESSFPRGTMNRGSWYLEVEYQSRDGNIYSKDGVPFTAIMTISDPLKIAPVYNEMRQNIMAAGAKITDIQNAVTITQRV